MADRRQPAKGSHDETSPLLHQGDDFAGSGAAEVSAPASNSQSPPPNQLSKLRAYLVILLFVFLILVQTSNVSIITTISGSIAHDLDAFSSTSWFTSAYIIAMSSTTPLAGRLCKIFPPRLYVFISGVIMAIGLLVTSFAQNLAVFLVGRSIMGIGAGGCFTVAMLLVTHFGSVERRGLLLGILNSTFTIGVASGAAFSGALEAALGWRAVFWLQIPVALLTSSGLLLAIPENARPGSKVVQESWSEKLSRVDYPGIAALTTSVVLFLYSLSAAEIHFLPIILSVLGLFMFLACEAYFASEPIVPIPILKSRGVFLTCMSMLFFMSARWTVLFYTPIYTIAVREWSPATGGLILLPTNLGFAIGSIAAGLLIRDASSFYFSCLLVYAVFGASLFTLSILSTAGSSAVAYIITTGTNGILAGAALNYVLAHILYLTPGPAHPIVLSLVALFRGLGGSFGSAIGGGVFLRALKHELESGFREKGLTGTDDLVNRLLGAPSLVRQLRGVEHSVATDAYSGAVRTLFLAGCALILLILPFQAGAGWKAAQIDGIETTDQQRQQDDGIDNDERER